MNPFLLARARLTTPWPVDRVCTAIDELLSEGFELEDRHYRLFGARARGAFSMSLGMPFLGGRAPVLRGRVGEGAGATAIDVTVGARHELVVLCAFWALVTLVGGSWQLLLQLRRVLAHEASFGAVVEVLPGIAIMAGIVALGIVLWRHGQVPRAHALIEQLRLHVGANKAFDRTVPPAPLPIH